MVAKTYFEGWFIIDFFAIIPLDLLLTGAGESTNMVRLTRIGRIYKIMKLMKLVRLLKMTNAAKTEGLTTHMQELLRINMAFKRLFLFFCYFLMITHVVTCCWIITGAMDEAQGSWMAGEDVAGMTDSELYLTSYYFTITTITTVGYGDLSANTFAEKIVCIIIMFIGVIAFSFASGSLTNYIQQ